MSISTSHKLDTASSSQVNESTSRHLQVAQASVKSAKTNIQDFDRNIIEVVVSDAETQVIASKARKAGLSINEYMRYAALGFPMP